MILDEPLKFNKPCQKQTVVAFLVSADGKRLYIGTNWCETPVEPGQCPRVLQGMASGEGYHLCKEVCHQFAHAEVDALRQAGKDAKGSIVYVVGHTRICEGCENEMEFCGVSEWNIIK